MNETGTKFIDREANEPEIAENVLFGGIIDCKHKVVIEKDVFTGHDVKLLTGSHDYTKFGIERRHFVTGGPITIREGVWIASYAIILGPCEIGKHSVVGAGSVVTTEKIPEYQLWGGNPARFIKEIPH